MKTKLMTMCAVVGMILAISGVAQATIYTYDVSPGDLADGPTFDNGRGGVPFGYDPDSVKPTGSNQTGPAGFGDSCFWADVQGSAAGGGLARSFRPGSGEKYERRGEPAAACRLPLRYSR